MATCLADQITGNSGTIYVSGAPDHGAWVRTVKGHTTVEVCLSAEELDSVIAALQKHRTRAEDIDSMIATFQQ